MPVVMSMHWPEASLEQYEQVRKIVGWEKNPDPKGLFHIAWMADDGFRVVDLWNTPEDFQRFNDTRLASAIQKVGIQGQPDVRFAPVHAYFNPFVPMTGKRSSAPSSKRPPARRARPAAKKVAKARKSGGRSKAAKKKSRR